MSYHHDCFLVEMDNVLGISVAKADVIFDVSLRAQTRPLSICSKLGTRGVAWDLSQGSRVVAVLGRAGRACRRRQ
jgi:hypothetical protein